VVAAVACATNAASRDTSPETAPTPARQSAVVVMEAVVAEEDRAAALSRVSLAARRAIGRATALRGKLAGALSTHN